MTTSPPTPPDAWIYDHATAFLGALLDSADVATIGAANWWDRAKTALETAAAASTSWPQCVTKACKKLQIQVLTEQSSQQVGVLGADARMSAAGFAAWRAVVTRDAIYITALTRNERTTRRAARKSIIDQKETAL